MLDEAIVANITESGVLPLLHRWADLAQDECKVIKADRTPTNVQAINIFELGEFGFVTIDEPLDKRNSAIVLGAVMSAIAQRDLLVEVELYRSIETQELRWEVLVWHAEQASRFDYDTPRGDNDDADLAIATLTAYLKALEVAK